MNQHVTLCVFLTIVSILYYESILKTKNEHLVSVCIKPPRRSYNNSSSSNNVTNGDNDPRIWRVLPKFCSIAQTTGSGKPLSQRVMNRNFFKFDNTYKDVTPRQLYVDNVQDMVHKFVSDGRNGTIFTHGFHVDDSSLHTMIHLAAKDLFLHIQNDHHNQYLVRVSFLAIHNEDIIDVSQKNDTNHGKNKIESDDDYSDQRIHVNSNEIIVTRQESIPQIFLQGKNRITKLENTFTKRSTTHPHSVFKITVEKTNYHHDQTQLDNPDRSGTQQAKVLTFSLSFVNLGKSERYTSLRNDESKFNQDIIIDQR